MSGPASTLNADEVTALMSAIQSGRITPEAAGANKKPIVPYDLTSQDRIIRGQMPTLDAINEQTAAALGIGLAGRTRLSLRVTAAPSTLMKFIDLNSVLAPPMAAWVLSLGLGHGHALVVMEPALAEALLAAALGDRKAQSSTAQGENREFTAVEQLVLRRLLAIFTDALTKAWEPVVPFRPEVIRFESDTRMTHIAPQNEVAILCPFDLSGGIDGRLQLIIPYAAVEPAKARLSSPPRVAASADQRFSASLERELHQVSVELRGLLGHARLPLQKLLELQVGDVLTLDTDEGAPLPITVQGQLKMVGSPRVSSGSMALEIQGGPSLPQHIRDARALAAPFVVPAAPIALAPPPVPLFPSAPSAPGKH